MKRCELLLEGMTEAQFSGRRIAGPADLAAGVAALCAADFRLLAVARSAGELPLRLDAPGFAGIARIVVGQMVSRASADAIWRRFGEQAGAGTARGFARLSGDACRAIGLSRAKEETLRAIAAAEIEGRIDLAGLCRLPAREAVGQLTAIRGVGPWTAEVYLLFCAGHPDIFPSGDVALQSAVAHAFALDQRPQARLLSQIAAGWRPWRGVAAHLFWAYYSREIRRSVGRSAQDASTAGSSPV